MVRYPHTLVVQWQESVERDPVTGQYSAGVKVVKKIKGRAEPNSQAVAGKGIKLEGGDVFTYDWKFYCRDTENVPHRAKAEIQELGWKGQIQRSHNYNMGGVIWL